MEHNEAPKNPAKEILEIVDAAIENIRKSLIEEENTVIDKFIEERGSHLQKDEVRLLEDALRSRIPVEREKFLGELKKDFIVKTPDLSQEEIQAMYNQKKEEYEDRLIKLIISIYSEFHPTD